MFRTMKNAAGPGGNAFIDCIFRPALNVLASFSAVMFEILVVE